MTYEFPVSSCRAPLKPLFFDENETENFLDSLS
jgi:hypothetical protein